MNPSDGSHPRRIPGWLASALVVALLAGIAVLLAGRREELASLQRLSTEVLILTCVLQFVAQLFLNASMLVPLQSCVKTLGFWELYLVRTGGFLAGALVPVAGGLAVRLAYLQARGLTLLDFTWATLLSNLLALGAAAVLGAVATVALSIVAGPLPAPIIAISAGVLAISIAGQALFASLPRLSRGSRLARWPRLSGLTTLKVTSRRMMMAVFLLAVARHAFNFLTFGVLSEALSAEPGDFLPGGLVYLLTSPVRMINITPGNLGVTEWVIALVGKALDFDLTVGLIVALTFRVVGLAGQALGVVFGSLLLARAGHR